MKVLITGAKGFIGGNLLDLLSDYDTKGIARNEESINKKKIYSFDRLSEIKFQPEVLIMCHGAVASGTTIISDTTLFDSNITLTKMVLNKFKDAFVIYLSSCSVYKITDNTLIKEISPIYPNSTYSISKLWGEILSFQRKNSVVIRLASVYGSSMKENTLIPSYIKAAMKNNIINVWGLGKREQNYIHINDLAQMIKKIIQKRKKLSNHILLGVYDKEYSNKQVAKIISNLTNCDVKFVNEDKSPSFNYDNQFSRSLLDWHPQIDLNTGIKKYIECIKGK